jgi:16S rRNA (guanine527-N7)-methyltransferase
MTEDEARSWLSDAGVSRETMEGLERFVALLLDEADRQNLISDSTRGTIWARHIVDSAQLVPLANDADQGLWIDLGSGAGLPGLVVALLQDGPVLLVESRRKRVEFLNHVIDELGLGSRVTVEGRRVETLPGNTVGAVISARAFAPLDRLFTVAHHLSRSGTIWVLPKGQKAQSELDAAQETWQGVFHVKQSVTDPDSAIIVAGYVQRGAR